MSKTIILSIKLIRENYTVTVLNDGKNVIENFLKNEYSILLLDLMLPNISGKEICKKLREKSNMPIIL